MLFTMRYSPRGIFRGHLKDSLRIFLERIILSRKFPSLSHYLLKVYAVWNSLWYIVFWNILLPLRILLVGSESGREDALEK